jgi:hypothetical protein
MIGPGQEFQWTQGDKVDALSPTSNNWLVRAHKTIACRILVQLYSVHHFVGKPEAF